LAAQFAFYFSSFFSFSLAINQGCLFSKLFPSFLPWPSSLNQFAVS